MSTPSPSSRARAGGDATLTGDFAAYSQALYARIDSDPHFFIANQEVMAGMTFQSRAPWPASRHRELCRVVTASDGTPSIVDSNFMFAAEVGTRADGTRLGPSGTVPPSTVVSFLSISRQLLLMTITDW